jgi:hypothetical protein
VTHNGRYQLESGRSENRMIRVTCEGESIPARLGAMDPENFARGLLLEIVGKQTNGRRPIDSPPRNALDHVAVALFRTGL